jgi:Transposase DDE domain
VQRRLDEHPEKMRQRRETVEHPFGTIKARMGAIHFLMKTLPRVASEMALHILAYNLTRVMNIMGTQRSWQQSEHSGLKSGGLSIRKGYRDSNPRPFLHGQDPEQTHGELSRIGVIRYGAYPQRRSGRERRARDRAWSQ